MQEILIWEDGKLNTDCTVSMLKEARRTPQTLIWLDLNIQSEDEVDKYTDLLIEDFNLTPLTIDTIKEEKERARLVAQHNYLYMVLHGLEFDQNTLEARTPKLDVVFDHNFFITVHRGMLNWMDELIASVRQNNLTQDIVRFGIGSLMQTVLDHLTDSYFPILDVIDDVVDDLEDAAVDRATTEVQSRIFKMKRSLAQMRRVVSPQVEMVNSLIVHTKDFVPPDFQPYFTDVHDHMVRVFEVLDSYRDLMSSLLDVYLSTVSNRLNEIMKALAIVSTIFLPITFITGVFGQNFGHSPQIEHDNGWNFWIVLGIMALITLVQIMYFRYRKWI
jgi:magnesium transporter